MQGPFSPAARSPNARPTPQCPISREVVDELNVVALNVSSGQATARDALTAAQHHIDAIWTSYQERRKLRAAKEGG